MHVRLLLVALALAAPSAARAAEERWSIPYGRDYVVPERCETPRPRMTTIADAPWQTVYLNFDGGQLIQDGNDATQNRTNLILVPTLDYPPTDFSRLGGREQGMKAVVDALKLIFLEYGVKLVTERPAEGNYTMAMIGGTGEDCQKGGQGTVGIAPLDCDNANENDVVLVYADLVNTTAKKIAFVVAHELGHSFGLEHVDDEEGIMYPALNSSTCCWVSAGLAEGSSCGRTTQDSKQVLLDSLGPGRQDTVPPVAWIVRPGAGAVLPPSFTFEVTAGDDLGVHHVDIYLDGKEHMTFVDAPFTSVISRMADGEHVIRVEAHDWIGNKSVAETRFRVDASCVAAGNCYRGLTGIGSSCLDGSECLTGLCATKDGQGVCADSCSAATELQVCPLGLACIDTDGAGAWACVPGAGFTLSSASDGGGCRVGGARTELHGALWLLLLLAWSAARRQRFGAERGR